MPEKRISTWEFDDDSDAEVEPMSIDATSHPTLHDGPMSTGPTLHVKPMSTGPTFA